MKAIISTFFFILIVTFDCLTDCINKGSTARVQPGGGYFFSSRTRSSSVYLSMLTYFSFIETLIVKVPNGPHERLHWQLAA